MFYVEFQRWFTKQVLHAPAQPIIFQRQWSYIATIGIWSSQWFCLFDNMFPTPECFLLQLSLAFTCSWQWQMMLPIAMRAWFLEIIDFFSTPITESQSPVHHLGTRVLGLPIFPVQCYFIVPHSVEYVCFVLDNWSRKLNLSERSS